MANNPNAAENLKPFQKGDKRINRKGRPRSFDAVRKLAQDILAEALEVGDQEAITRIQAMLRLMSSSRNPADRKTLLEYAYGKPKEQVEQTGEITQKVVFVVERKQVPNFTPDPAPEAGRVSIESGETQSDSGGT